MSHLHPRPLTTPQQLPSSCLGQFLLERLLVSAPPSTCLHEVINKSFLQERVEIANLQSPSGGNQALNTVTQNSLVWVPVCWFSPGCAGRSQPQ